MSKRKINVPAPTKAELKAELKTLVKDYFEKGGVIKVYPTRHLTGAYRSTIVSAKKGS